MNRSFGFAAAWLAGTLVAVLIAAAAVGSVRNEVTDAPTALGAPNTTISLPDPDSGPSTTVTDDIEVPVTDEVAESTTTTTLLEEPTESESTTTTTTDPGQQTSTTVPTTTAPEHDPAPTTTTTTEAPSETTTTINSYTKTYDVKDAGRVTIRVSGDSVTFAGAYPLEGWTFKLKNGGSEEVEVRFERNDDEEDRVSFKAKIDDGELEVKISDDD
jgi:hypothetical protein